MTAIYQGRFCWKNGKRYDFPLSFIFDCPDCELVVPATSEDAAVSLAFVHAVTSGHRVFLAALASEKADERFVALARRVAKLAAAS